jgi:tetratricopeptide (TPR) repeat protein
VALLFAVHPINVETVAWAAERKGVLSSLFWMLSLWSYAGYAQRPSVKKYLPVMAFMSLGLMAKQMLVTLPLVFLLLDYWPLGRFRTGRTEVARGQRTRGAWERLMDTGAPRLVLEKLPLFALSIISAIVIFILQRESGLVSSIESLPLKYRLSNAFNSYFEYVRKLFLPNDLACFYPPVNVPLWRAALCVLFMAAITAAVIYAGKRKYLLTGWLWYVVALVPVVGFVQISDQSMADRYAYIPTVGLFVMAVWGAADIVAGKPGRKVVALLSLAALIVSFTAYTRTQVRYWQNYAALFSHAAKVTKGNYIAYISMGNFMFKAGRFNEALVLFSEALKINPRYAEAHYSYGLTLLNLNRPGEAVGYLTNAIALREDFVDAYNATGAALLAMGKPQEAVALHKKAVALNPDYSLSYNNMGLAYLKMGDLLNAEDCFGKAIAINPGVAAYRENLQTVQRARLQRARGRTQ